MDYSNKVVVVTGSSKGIGLKTVEYFLNKGCQVIMTYLNSEVLSNNKCTMLNEMYHNKVINVKCDLRKEEDIKKLFDIIKQKYGHLDILINNASISLDSKIEEKTKEEFMNVLETNVVGTFLMIKYMINIMDENSFIFNISSTDGIDTGSSLSVDYSSSKAAINNMTMTMSLEIKPKIISICPNWVDTESTREANPDYINEEMKRVGQKELIDPIEIPKTIDKVINENIKTGSIIRIEG